MHAVGVRAGGSGVCCRMDVARVLLRSSDRGNSGLRSIVINQTYPGYCYNKLITLIVATPSLTDFFIFFLFFSFFFYYPTKFKPDEVTQLVGYSDRVLVCDLCVYSCLKR